MARDTQDGLLDHVPPGLREVGPQHLPWWQWLGLPALALASLALAIPLSLLSRALIHRLLHRDSQASGADWLHRVSGPLLLAWVTALFALGLPWLKLPEQARAVVHVGLRALGLLAFYWLLSRGIDVARGLLAGSAWGRSHPSTRSLLPLGTKVAKVFVVVLAVVAFLSELGYPVASLVAGLGIGGVAVALGAQKTLENVFGTFSIGADQPFLQGDFVRVGELTGTVEVVGLRSTRIRTVDRTLVTIPNGKLADQQIESFAVRDRLCLNTVLGLRSDSSAEQVRAVLAGLERVLREHPKLWPEGFSVRFVGIGESSFRLEVMAWFATTDWNEFLVIRQETLLRFLEVVGAAGSAFAFPTRSLQLVTSAAPRSPHPSGET